MDKIWEILLPSIPPWLLWPIAVIALLLFLWPRLRAVWQDFVPSQRAYNRAKMALELQKLMYEIEALRRQQGGRDIEQELPEQLRGTKEARDFLRDTFQRPAPARVEAVAHGRFERRYVLFGGLGGLTVAVLPLISGGLGAVDWSNTALLLGFGVRALTLAVLGSVIVFMQRPGSPQLAFLVGAAPGLVMQVVISGVAPPADVPTQPPLSAPRMG